MLYESAVTQSHRQIHQQLLALRQKLDRLDAQCHTDPIDDAAETEVRLLSIDITLLKNTLTLARTHEAKAQKQLTLTLERYG
jgi:predicted mannosyl-3-phosphoglycerate phosphatase (HAD superfamily)